MKLLTREGVLCAEMSPGAARLCRFALRVRGGEEPDSADVLAIAEAFERIVAGQDAKKALGLAGKKSQGRRKQTAAEYGRSIFRPVLEIEWLRLREGLKLQEALDQVSESLAVSRNTLETNHKRYRKLVIGIATEMVRHAELLDAIEAESAGQGKKTIRFRGGGKKSA